MCFTPESEPETCEQLGILNTTSHIVASIQVQEAMKIAIKKRPETSLIRYKNNSITLIKVKKRKNCRCCNKQYDYL